MSMLLPVFLGITALPFFIIHAAELSRPARLRIFLMDLLGLLMSAFVLATSVCSLAGWL